ncbi:hypothetical protein [Nitratireductor sp. XY-223]|uniref:hypothetical protein n=1 Tax=Nitratireductor sp. XY-223 TaxID=2561926 RepID=UPI0010AA0877|nr:hypothetical protein [Nitratireductor sp. XY-223]
MIRGVSLFISVFLIFLGVTLRAGDAGVTRPGQFYSGAPGPFLVAPAGQYRTRLGWLIGSMITYDNMGFFDKFSFFAPVVPGKYQDSVRAELNHYRGLQGMAYYRYSEALVRDLARLQIMTLENDRLSLALSTVPAALLADISAMALNSGIKHILPAQRQGVLALDSQYLTPGTEQNIAARYAFADLEIRYSELLGQSYMNSVRQKLGQQVTASELRDLMSESVISAAVGQTIAEFSQSPERLMDVLRRQKVMDVAAYGCACVLDNKTHRPPDAVVAVLGPTDSYRTRLGFLLSVQLTPPNTTILNVMSGAQAQAFLGNELAAVRKMRSGEPLRYASYMRSLLVDLEQLEEEQIKALQSGMPRALIESTVINVLFGAMALGGGGTAQVVSILANAGYGALSSYATMSDELKVRAQMAALRETVLDQILPLADKCGCGAGLAVAPKTVKQGETSGDN